MSSELTGRHILVILALFFLAMFVANGALAYFALSTLHGSELENPYDASSPITLGLPRRGRRTTGNGQRA